MLQHFGTGFQSITDSLRVIPQARPAVSTASHFNRSLNPAGLSCGSFGFFLQSEGPTTRALGRLIYRRQISRPSEGGGMRLD